LHAASGDPICRTTRNSPCSLSIGISCSTRQGAAPPSLSSPAAGHPGAGGSHAFADPENGIAFAYVMNQMEPGVLPTPKTLRLIEALYAET